VNPLRASLARLPDTETGSYDAGVARATRDVTMTSISGTLVVRNVVDQGDAFITACFCTRGGPSAEPTRSSSAPWGLHLEPTP
jgi:hypothetical protein